MRQSFLLMLLLSSALGGNALAKQQALAVTHLLVQAQPDVKDLECEKTPPRAPSPAVVNPDPMEIPNAEVLSEEMQEAPPAETPVGIVAPPLHAIRPADGYRIAIWGDSHLAAGFFSQELMKQLKLPADADASARIPANMGRAGVRLPIRRSCVSAQWKYEPVYLGGAGAVAPGPGMVNMVSDQAGATLAWDLKNAGAPARYERVRILYEQTANTIMVGISVDGGPETEVRLAQAAGPAVLELEAEQPISQVKLRLIDARLRFHGLDLMSKQPNSVQMDVFGYPGATVASWKSANLDYLRSWFTPNNYQLVMLEFGTNEGNDKPFNLAGYRKTLTEAVHNMRTVFPTAACMLIAPGDRGVLVRRSVNSRVKSAAKTRGKKSTDKAALAEAASNKRSGKKKAGSGADLFQYSKIHSEIERVQAEVATEAGCGAWSMMHAMGGAGSAYKWVRQSPALMASDMIHFTVGGYQRLAQQFAIDTAWRTLFTPDLAAPVQDAAK